MREGLEGALLGGGIFFLFFLVRGMGAGDVKLMAAIGSLAGVQQSWVIILATAIAGGILAVGYMIFYKRFGRTLANVGALVRFHLTSGLQPHPEVSLQNPEAIRMPYALAIAAGTFYSLGKVFLRV
jgi:prepilin peptidase CpaA